ncbi:MAG: hypothetical protein BZY80_03240 [SAR202 cluster bacterium Io17-Chloro-G2]|nr:MAG: hypothetical protein BZY80_03240 [SAR202 cluster bacterium Io17-Chloro-G2]
MPKLTIIGTGLIGTSLAMALQQAKLKDLEIVGTDSDNTSRSGANKTNAFHRVENRLSNAVRDAGIVVLATPVMAMQEVMEVIADDLAEGCVVTDVGSSKKVVLDWADQYLPRHVEFVGGHPMAGREKSGPENADGNLFRDKVYCVVPSSRASSRAVSEITNIADAIGARSYFIGVDEHDSFVAAVSHLPFLLSVALVGCTSKSPNWDDIAQLAATGYEDSSRLASGDPVMHRDICLSNPEPIVAWIDSFIKELYEVRQLLNAEPGPDRDSVHDVFEKAFVARGLWQAGAVNQAFKVHQSQLDVPSFGESVGDFFGGGLARKAIQSQKKLFGGDRDDRSGDR